MQVTDVRITKSQNLDSRAKATASVTLDNEFAIHGIRVIEGDTGTFISFPSKRLPSGDYKDIAHPINSDARAKIQNAILEAYNNLD